MNNFYQVIWSHARHCYVVTSELAKRNGKGCGTRSLPMAAVSMALASALISGIGGSVAEAEGVSRLEEGGEGTFPAANGNYYSPENLHWNPAIKNVTVTASSLCSDGEPVSAETVARRYMIGNIIYQDSSNTTNVLDDQHKSMFKFEEGKLKRYYTNPGMIAQQYQQHIEDYADANKDVSGYSVTVDLGSSGNASNDDVYGGYAQFGKASDNSVTVESGVLSKIYGGYSASSDATGNSVTINGTLGNGNAYIYGGLAPNGEASNNTVNILTAVNVNHIVGGDGTTSMGNTLNVNAIGVTVGDDGINGFQNMNFFLPDGAAGKTMLTVNAKDAFGNGAATNLTGVAIGAAVQTGANLSPGDTVNLITNPSGLTTDGTTTMKQITDETVTIQTKPSPKTLTTDQSYTLEIAQTEDKKTIIATVKDAKETPSEEGGGEPGGSGGETGGSGGDGGSGDIQQKSKSLVETRAAIMTIVNAGADMLASQGFAQAANAVALDMAEQTENGAPATSGFTPFAAFGGSSLRAESGSHVNTKGFSLNIGFAREIANSQGKLLFGPVIEYGGGNYDSYLDNGAHGKGGAHYFGLGLMARQVNHNGFYYEGSIRGGRVSSDYESNDVRTGVKVGYDSDSNYWAAHLGIGKVFTAGKRDSVDAYLKYFYSHQAGDNVAIKFNGQETGDRGNFESVDSNRIRIGARYTHKINERNSFYGGLAYQYEFGGEARAHFTGVGETPSPSMKGSSGMLELGWQVKPGGPVTIDLGVNGWVGKQRGGSVQFGATWTF